MTHPAPLHTDNLLKGVLCAVLFSALLAIMQATGKILSASHQPVEIAFYRNLIGVFIVGGWLALRKEWPLFHTKRPVAHLLRGLVGTAGLVLTFAAFARLPMAETTTLLFTSSLISPVLGILFLKESVGKWRWIAILIGFTGVLIALSPAGRSVDWIGVGLALTCAVIHAFVFIILRWLGRTENPLTVTFYFILSGALMTGLAMPFIGHPLAIHDIPAILIMAISGSLAQVLLTMAYKYAPAATISPISYSSLLWAVSFDWLLWSHIPGWTVMAGAILIISSNLLILWHEQNTRKKAAALVDAAAFE
jgi:drug/metabolite transporter (DMT)-like permease